MISPSWPWSEDSFRHGSYQASVISFALTPKAHCFALGTSGQTIWTIGRMHSTPVSLLEKLRLTGDALAWERFVTLYTPLLYHWLLRTGVSPTDVADLVQEVFAVLVRRLPEFRRDPSQSFHRWLYVVTLNLWRARQRKPAAVSLDGTIAEPAAPDDLASFIDTEYRANLAQRAFSILEADFSPLTRRIFRQLVIDGEPGEAVAAANGVSLGAVYAAKCRVLTRLRQELDGLWE
jgi:RNA polymerase sigma-70 factor (ECF subfamily)